MAEKRGTCVRCGIAVFVPGSACRDCEQVDPHLVAEWRTEYAPAVVVRPADCAVPSAGAVERHRWRGEPACRACVDHKEARRKTPRRAVA